MAENLMEREKDDKSQNNKSEEEAEETVNPLNATPLARIKLRNI